MPPVGVVDDFSVRPRSPELARSCNIMAQRIMPGDVVAVPLDDGRFAFGLVFKDASIGVYEYASPASAARPPPDARFLFVVGVYCDVRTCGEWPCVARGRIECE